MYSAAKSETKKLHLELYHPYSLYYVFANLQSMTNGNTVYHTDLPGSWHINTYFPSKNPK